MTRGLILCAPLLLGACTVWPPSGTGGWAEHQPETTSSATRLVMAQHRFEQLANGEPGRQRPAAVLETRVLLVRALRSTAAELEPAVEMDLATLERALAELESRTAGPKPLVGTRESAS